MCIKIYAITRSPGNIKLLHWKPLNIVLPRKIHIPKIEDLKARKRHQMECHNKLNIHRWIAGVDAIK